MSLEQDKFFPRKNLEIPKKLNYYIGMDGHDYDTLEGLKWANKSYKELHSQIPVEKFTPRGK